MDDSGAETFELVKPLGSGAFAHTYKARVLDQELIEDYGTDIVALKIPLDKKKERVLRKEIETNAYLDRKLREIKSCNLVRYLGFEIFRGQTIMAMEYAPGSLREEIGKIGTQKPMKVDAAVRIAREILNGLAIIHENRVFHRDIKPENILGMKSGGIPKISDLGISRMLDSDEMASTTTGTVYFMSPEVLTREASFKSDVWSLGATFYEMLAGRLPFGKPKEPIGKIVQSILSDRQIPVHEILTEIPEKLSSIVDKSLDKNVETRYSAKEMLEALVKFEQGGVEEFEQKLAELSVKTADCEHTGSVEKQYQELLKKYPKEPRAYLCFGSFLNKCQRHSDAENIFKRGLLLDSGNDLLNFDLGMIYLSQGRKGDASACFTKVVNHTGDISLKRKGKILLRSIGV